MNKDSRRVVAENINIQLSIHGYSQADMARYMGVSTATTSDWCAGEKMPRADKLERLCDWFDIRISDLFSDNKADTSKEVFTTNLRRYMDINNVTQKEVADAINVSPQSFNSWMQGIAIPRMDKIQAIADFFGIHKSDLLDKHEESISYYYDETIKQVAELVRSDMSYRTLFKAAIGSKTEDLLRAADLLNRFKELYA